MLIPHLLLVLLVLMTTRRRTKKKKWREWAATLIAQEEAILQKPGPWHLASSLF